MIELLVSGLRFLIQSDVRVLVQIYFLDGFGRHGCWRNTGYYVSLRKQVLLGGSAVVSMREVYVGRLLLLG